MMWFEGVGKKPPRVSFPLSVTETEAPVTFHLCLGCWQLKKIFIKK